MKPIALLLSLAFVGATAGAKDATYTYRPLFDGKTLDGWKGDGYIVEDGAIVCTPQGRNLTTEQTFANYILEFEFKLPTGGNNGLGIHYPGQGDAAYAGMELQVLDNTADKYKDLKPYQFHGSLYTLAPAKTGHLKPVGEWNSQRVFVFDNIVKVDLNGTTILEADLDKLAASHPDHQGVKRRAGHLALCGHGDRVAFRKFRICELPPAANVPAVTQAGYTALFDGHTFKGWKGDGEGHWQAANGVLKYDGKGKDLWTEASYGDFTMVFDWRWGGRGPMAERPILAPDGSQTGETENVEELDSGIYLRGNTKSQVNLWNWPAGSGEVYGYRTDGSMPAEIRAGVTPKAKADKPLGEWNRMMITMKGELLTVVLNGQTVIEEARLPGVPAEGPIGLQHHGAALDFANIWIKKL